MANFFLIFFFFIIVGQVNAQKLIAAYQFEKDTLFRFHYQDEVIIKNSNELRLWMEDQESAMDSTLFEYIVYQLGVLPQRLIPCEFVPLRSFSKTPPIRARSNQPTGCGSGGSISICTKVYTELPPCIMTELDSLDIEIDLDLDLGIGIGMDNTDSDYKYTFNVQQRINEIRRTIQNTWHKEFPIKNDSFYTSVADNIEHVNDVYLLSLSGQKLSRIPEDIKYFKNITELYMLDNNLTELPPYLFELENLRVLHLANNQITRIPPEIAQLKRLEQLYLDGNPIQDLPPEFFTLPRLTSINLSYTQLSKVSAAFANFNWLQELNLRGVVVEQISTKLSQLYFLETISIDEMSPIIYEEESAKTLEALRVFVTQN